ncbi:PIN domain-containing protein [Taklimakanibacter deserti]|uniref:PIN domain-containing protein n=1 Tax=Taklimakanibacter deserti TaxID=2267839 RepID=UPI000E64BA5C
MPGSFFDTNVLVYLLSDDQAKADRAGVLIEEGGTVSVQVLNELANVARRKRTLPWSELRQFLSTVCSLLEVCPLTKELHDRGLALAEHHKLSVYDAMIVAAALEAGCETLWSEDMHHGLMIEHQLRIINPFVAA